MKMSLKVGVSLNMALSMVSQKQFFYDERYMREALSLASCAFDKDEVPVGAVVVKGGEIVASGFNQKEHLCNVVAHAEILALQGAQKKLQTWRLSDCELFVSLEPCLMCAGALLACRMGRVVYGASDPKGGAVASLFTVFDDERLNHRIQWRSGVLEKESSQILKNFFLNRR